MKQQHTAVTQVNLAFSDSKIPDFKSKFGDKYFKFGHDNKYPDYLLNLFNKSAKHRAILNGKVKYIFGGGLAYDGENPLADKFINSFPTKKVISDIETFGGVYLQIIPTVFTGGFSVYHISFRNIRKSICGTKFLYKEDWTKTWEEPTVFPMFTPDCKGTSIFCYNEYSPYQSPYALPGYVAGCNWIESDIEVSKATLTNAKTGFSATKFINFFSGMPTDEVKKITSDKFESYVTGSEGKKILIGYNNASTTAPTIDDLGASDLTKEDFTQVDNLITNNIFTSHEITHPLLFGIQQEGKLGGATELKTAFDIFKNTYVNNKQEQTDRIVNYFARIKGLVEEFYLTDVDPIGVEINALMITEALSKEEVRELLGYAAEQETIGNQAVSRAINSLSPLVANKVLEKMTPDEVRSLAGLAPTLGGGNIETNANLIPTATSETLANEHLKNLTGRQSQQIDRIIRKYNQGNYTIDQARTMLKGGFGLTDEEINAMLGANEFSDQQASDEVLTALFEAHGEDAAGYEIRSTKPATFTDDDKFEMAFSIWDKVLEYFKDAPVADPQTQTNPSLSKGGGGGSKIGIKDVPKLLVRYSYEKRDDAQGNPIIATSRPFCKFMVGRPKLYSEQEINKISDLLGYNVFKQVGGFWNDNGVNKSHCRHIWKANLVLKK